MSTLDNEKRTDIKTVSMQTSTWVRLNDLNAEMVRAKQSRVTRTEQIEVLMLAHSRLKSAIITLKEWKYGFEHGEPDIAEKNINDLLKKIDLDEGVKE